MEKSVRTLDFKNNLEVLTLDELSMTQKEDEVGFVSKQRLRHDDFIFDIGRRITSAGLEMEQEPIYIRKGGPSTAPNANVYPFLEEKWGENALQAHVIRKLVTRINITTMQNKETQASIGIGFNQHGIILAFGQNVFVCSNMSIWGENVISNYGSSKMGTQEVLARFDDWMAGYEVKRKIDLKIISAMKRREASHKIIPDLIGQMQMAAVRQAYLKGEQAPFNISQITDFTKNYLKRLQNEEQLEIRNIWDLYNIGTRLLRANEMRDLEPIFHQNQVFGNFLMDKFSLISSTINTPI